MSFQNLKLHISDAQQIEALSEQLMEAGALSITLEDAGDNPIFEPLPNEVILWTETILIALFPQEADLEPLIKILQEADYIHDCIQEAVPDSDWQAVWTQTTEPLCFYDRTCARDESQLLWICPSFCDSKDFSGAVVHLDPGLAFGTGTHPTTALCLDWLAGHPPKQQSVIDYGCGSGILGIAALQLGAKKVYAVDHDPQALQATESNAQLNGIDRDAMVILNLELKLPLGQADVLLANILANPLIELSDYFSTLLKSRGHIVLSGILTDQVTAVRSAYALYFDDIQVIENEGWAMISGCKK